MPSIIIAGKSIPVSERLSHCSTCSALNSTNRRDTALLDTEHSRSLAGSGSSTPR
jgi:hypothetical protein